MATGALADRMLAALLATASRRHITALVAAAEPPLAVVVLPDLGAGVVIVDRGSDPPESLKARIEKILQAHAAGVLHVVLAGGSAADRDVLRAADRDAPDPNRLGVHLLSERDGLSRVAGRRLALLGEAAQHLDEVTPLDAAALATHNAAAQKSREEAATFAAALDHRPQRAIRLLGAACIVMFALAHAWGQRSYGTALLHMGANSALLVGEGEWWRLVSHAFLHGNATHLIVNLIGLFSFGGFLEGLLGWRRIVVLYGLSALAGGLASAFIGRAPVSVGASGAIWGLMAAGIGIVLQRNAILPPLIVARLRPRLLAVLAVNVVFSLMPLFLADFPRIDLWAHAGGGLAGFALAATGVLTRGLVSGEPPNQASAHSNWMRALALATLALMVVSVGAALAFGQPWQPQVVFEPDQIT